MTFRKNWKLKSFNSRSRKEIDISYCPRRAGLLLFQLTTSRRGRRISFDSTYTSPYFNSRPHEEVDALVLNCQLILQYFNSRPRKEVDRHFWLTIRHLRYFNSRPHEEVDVNRHNWIQYDYTFQLTTSRRGRRSGVVIEGEK